MARVRQCLKCSSLFIGAGSYCARHPFGSEKRSTTERLGIYSTRRWRKIRAAFLAAHPTCEAPDCPHPGEPATDVDHIVRRRDGGTDDWSNLRAMSHSCHARRTLRDVNADRRRVG